MVWQRFAKSPGVACAGSSPVASAKSLPISNCQVPINQGGSGRILVERAIDNWQSAIGNVRTCSSADRERDSAKVEVARSNRARSTNQLRIAKLGLRIGR